MSDVFISYASADRAVVKEVEARLRDAGCSVWWDRRLVAGQRYQQTIQAELSVAAVVLVLWTPTSVSSDWVYSEARRGHQRRALVQLRAPQLSIDDLPAPFDALHCALIDDDDALLDAVRRLVDSPARRPLATEEVVVAPDERRLPELVGATIGREGEQADVLDLVRATRLVTLTGPGGSGKTRLATAVAERVADEPGLPDRVHFVPLAGATSAADVWPAIAAEMGLPDSGEVGVALLAEIGATEALLVLDNLEQVAEADDVVRTLLQLGPLLRLVVTSRRPLHVSGEHEHSVPPLALPVGDSFEASAASGAVQLFVQAARRVRGGFELTESNHLDVSSICAALDGLPLAIELVAARSKLLSPAALLSRIGSSLDVASSDRSLDPRQRTVRDTIQWSVDLLPPAAQHVLACLSVFVGGAALHAAEAVVPEDGCAGVLVEDVVLELVDHSLVRVTEGPDGEPRLDLLESVRVFGLERLAAIGRRGDLERRHAQFFYDLMVGHHDAVGGDGDAHLRLRREFLVELPNVRALGERGVREISHDRFYGDDFVPRGDVLVLLVHAAVYYRCFGEAVRWIEDCLSLGPDVPVGTTAVCLSDRCFLRSYVGTLADPDGALADAELAVSTLRSLGPAPGPPWLERDGALVEALMRLSRVLQERGEIASSAPLVEEMLELVRTLPPRARLKALEAALFQAEYEEDHEVAYDLLAETEELSVSLGLELSWLATQNNLADLDVRTGRPERALSRLVDGLDVLAARGDPALTAYWAETMAVALGTDRPRAAAQLYGAAAAWRERHSIPRSQVELEDDERFFDPIRGSVPAEVWEHEHAAGRDRDPVDLMRGLAAPRT